MSNKQPNKNDGRWGGFPVLGWSAPTAKAVTTLAGPTTCQLADALWSGAPWDASASHVLSVRVNHLAPTSSDVGGAAAARTGAG